MILFKLNVHSDNKIAEIISRGFEKELIENEMVFIINLI